MRNLFLKFLAAVRKITSPIIWHIVKKTLEEPPIDHWPKIKEYPLNVFLSLISAQTYKSDPLGGILDYTAYDHEYFFSVSNDDKKLYGRDCDDTAYITYEYLKNKSYVKECYMVMGMDKWKINTLHFWVVAKFDDGNYRLFNYGMHTTLFMDLEDACKEFEREELVSSGKHEDTGWVVYEKYEKE